MTTEDIILHLFCYVDDRMGKMAETVGEAISKVRSTCQSAMNFHQTLVSLVSDEAFDIGLYKPILSTNEARLDSMQGEIDSFQDEFEKVSGKLGRARDEVTEERSRRASGSVPSKRNLLRRLRSGVSSSVQTTDSQGRHSSAYETEVKLMFAVSRLVYGVVMASDIVL